MYAYDSRKIKPGDTYLCLPGGEMYCSSAKDKGAIKVIHCNRLEMANIANSEYDFPSQ